MTRSTLLVSCVLVAGCSLVLDPSAHQNGAGQRDAGTQDAAPEPDGGSEVDGGEVDAGEADAGPPCPGSLICEPGAPPGWNGPVLLVTGAGDAPPPSCPATIPMTAFVAFSGLEAPEATCGCTCNPPPNGLISCGSATITRHRTHDTTCATIETMLGTISHEQCRDISLSSTGWYLFVSRPPFSTTATGCSPMPEVAVSPPSWQASHRACTFGAPTRCGSEQVCMPPRANGERLCIWVEGASECPAAFPVRLETAEDVDDSRGCSPCTCGSIQGRCDGQVTITNTCDGPTSNPQVVDIEVCTRTYSWWSSSSPHVYAHFTPTASCPPSEPTPTGAATPTAPRTVCCVE